MRKIWAAVLLGYLGLYGSRVARADAIDDYLEDQLRRSHIPGLAVAVVRGGEVVKLRGYGRASLEWDTPVGPDTLFQIASATKMLTGLLLLRAVEDGQLGLDDPVSRHLPGTPAAWSGITIRHLASHTSCLPEDDGPAPAPANSVAEAVERLKPRPLRCRPGEQARYGNNDFVVLTAIMERLGGKPFPELLRERILHPLGMDAARFDFAVERGPVRSADPIPSRAAVYRWGGAGQKIYSFLYSRHTYAAGGLYASAKDLSRLALALQAGRPLRPAGFAQLWTPGPVREGPPNQFGLGWVVSRYRGRRAVGHSGGPALADLLHFPDDQLTIVVINNQQRLYPNLAQGVADRLLPPPPFLADKGRPDKDPVATANARRVLAGMAQGRLDAALFTPAAQQELVPDLSDFGPLILNWAQPLSALLLLEDSTEKGQRVRRYRAVYGNKTLLCRFNLAPDGRIAEVETTPE